METHKWILELTQLQSVSLRTFSINRGLGAEQYVHGAHLPKAWRPPCSIPKPRKTQTEKNDHLKGAAFHHLQPHIRGNVHAQNPRDPTVYRHLPWKSPGRVNQVLLSHNWLQIQVGIHEGFRHSLHSQGFWFCVLSLAQSPHWPKPSNDRLFQVQTTLSAEMLESLKLRNSRS